MADQGMLQGPADEIRALRERIAELERQISRLRVGDTSNPVPNPRASAAEKAVAGFFER